MKIAHITDLHFNDFISDYYKIDSRKRAEIIFADAISRNIDLVMLTGDYGNPSILAEFLKLLKENTIPYHFSLGNHDEIESFMELNDHNKFYTSILIENTDIILLNSHKGIIDDEQILWLKSVLLRTSNDILVFLHHPIINCGNTIMDKKYPLINRKEIEKILHTINNNLYVFAGHYHNDFKNISKNIMQYVIPSSIVQLSKSKWKIKMESKSFGYRIIEKDKDKLSTESVIFNQNLF